jgi:hypothetical protein
LTVAGGGTTTRSRLFDRLRLRERECEWGLFVRGGLNLGGLIVGRLRPPTARDVADDADADTFCSPPRP